MPFKNIYLLLFFFAEIFTCYLEVMFFHLTFVLNQFSIAVIIWFPFIKAGKANLLPHKFVTLILLFFKYQWISIMKNTQIFFENWESSPQLIAFLLSDRDRCHFTLKLIGNEEVILKSFMTLDIMPHGPIFRVVVRSQIMNPWQLPLLPLRWVQFSLYINSIYVALPHQISFGFSKKLKIYRKFI